MKTFALSTALFAAFGLSFFGTHSNAAGPEFTTWTSSPLAQHLMLRTQEGHQLLRQHTNLQFGKAPTVENLNQFAQEIGNNLAKDLQSRFDLAASRLKSSGIKIPARTLRAGSFNNTLQHERIQLYLKQLARAYLRAGLKTNELTGYEELSFEVNGAARREAAAALNREVKFLSEAVCEAKLMPARRWAVKKALVGPLEARIEAFAAKYPNNVRIIRPGTRFVQNEYTHLDGEMTRMRPPRVAVRPTIAISLSGMTSAAKTALFEDWLRAIANGTTSYPMSSNGSILYRRVGNQTFSYRDSHSDYRMIGDSEYRMEPVVALSPLEEYDWLNFHEYATDRNGLDEYDIDFDGSEDNCTSPGLFFTLATGRPYFELLGQKRRWDCADNPGWAMYSMLAAASAERIPFVAIWSSQKTVQTIADEATSGQLIEGWDFGRY